MINLKVKNNLNYLIVSNLEDRNWKLLNDIPKYKHSFINFICDNDHINKMSINNLLKGCICSKCRINNYISYEDACRYFNEKFYTVLTKKEEYLGSYKTKFNLICPNGHKINKTLTSLRTGSNCLICAGNKKVLFSDIIKDMEYEGYIIKTLELNFISQVKTKIEFTCSNGHNHKISYRKWKIGQRCSKCSRSKEERELDDYLSSIIESNLIIRNDRTVIRNVEKNSYLEIDFWIPSLNKAIEVNGKYWHSMSHKIKNDLIKNDFCKNANIDLLVIMDFDWNDNQKVTKNEIFKFIYN